MSISARRPNLISYGLDWEDSTEKKKKRKFFNDLPEKFWAVSKRMMMNNDLSEGDTGLKAFKKEMLKTGISITFKYSDV